MEFWYWFEHFLIDPKWAGIQGVVAVLALAAAVIAAIDIAVRANRDQINAMSFETRRHPERDGYIEFEVDARPMASTVLFEADWKVFGTRRYDADDFPPVMTASDAPVNITLSIPVDELQGVYVAVVHLVPARFGSKKLASRIRLSDLEYQWWQPYLWYHWPRKSLGRWKSNRARKRSLLAGP